MSATDIEIELNEFETSDSTLNKTTSIESQEISQVNWKILMKICWIRMKTRRVLRKKKKLQ